MKTTIAILLMITCSAFAQSALDQDPNEKALSESIFAHPPASSVGPRPAATVATDGQQAIRLQVAETATQARREGDEGYAYYHYREHRREVLEGFTIEVRADPMSSKPINGQLEMILLGRTSDGRWLLGGRSVAAVSIQPMGSLDETASTSQSMLGARAAWIVRLLGPDGKILGLTVSDPALATTARDDESIRQLTGRRRAEGIPGLQ